MAKLFANDTIEPSPKPESRLWRRWVDKNRAWSYVPALEKIIGMAPKCGSSTFYKALQSKGYTHLHPVQFDRESVWFVREPVERFISLWMNKCRDEHRVNREGVDEGIEGWEISELLEFIESNEEWNHHWGLQADMEGGHADTVLPLEALTPFLVEHGFEPVNHNVSSGALPGLTQDQIDRVLRYYEKDVDLYQRALRESRG